MAGCRTDVARHICVPIPARLDSSRLQPRGHNSTWDMLLRTTRNRIHGCYVCDCRLPVPKHLHLRLRRKCQPAYLAGRKATETPARVLRRKEPVRLDCHHHGRLYGTGTHFFACRTATHCVSAQHPVDYDRHGILRLGTYTRFVLGGPHFLGRNRPLQKKTAQAEPNELPEQKGSDRTNTGRTGHDSGNQVLSPGSGLLERIGRENR